MAPGHSGESGLPPAAAGYPESHPHAAGSGSSLSHSLEGFKPHGKEKMELELEAKIDFSSCNVQQKKINVSEGLL